MVRLRFALRTPALVTAAVVVASTSARAQGDNGFLRGAARTDVVLSYAFDQYDEYWIGNHKVKDPGVGEVTRESLHIYVAHGLRDDLDLVGTLAYVDAENDGSSRFSDQRHLQDLTLGVKWRFVDQRVGPGDFSLLAAPSVKIPVSHYEANSFTAIGDGQLDYRGRLIAQYRLDCGLWAAVESGFDYRTEHPGNELPFHCTLGVPITQYVTVMPYYSSVASEGDLDINQTDFPSVDEQFRRCGVALRVHLNESLDLTLGVKETLDGKNTGDVRGYWFGLVFKL